MTSTLPPEKSTGFLVNFLSNTNQSEPKCVSRQKPAFLLFTILPSSAILINVVVLIAVFRKARKLVRQSHVYAYVSSTLVANVLFSVLALVQLLSLYFHFGGLPNDPDPGRRGLIQEGSSRWWAFRKAFLCGMFVIMCGNIGLLIDCIRHNTCSALRSAAGCRNFPNQTSRWKKKFMTRRQRTYFFIGILWVVPIIYVAIPVVGWSCREVCTCLSQCFPDNYKHNVSHMTCSRAFPPMANSWLAVVVISWACCLIAIIFFLRRSMQQVSQMWKRCNNVSSMMQSTKTEEGSFNESHLANDTPIKDEVFVSNSQIEADTTQDAKVNDNNLVKKCKRNLSVETKSKSNNRTVSNSSSASLIRIRGLSAPHRRMMEHLRSTRTSSFSLRYVIWLTVFFGLCTAPAMIILTVDMLETNLVLDMVALNVCLLCPFIYCYICPFILVKCLPGVKTSLSALILSVYSTAG